MTREPKSKIRWHRVVVIAVLILFSLISLFPFWTMIMMSTYSSADIYTGVKLLPGNYFGQNLTSLSKIAFPTYYSNSLIVAASCSLLTVFVCSLAGYAFAKFRFKGRDFLLNIVILALMIRCSWASSAWSSR